MTFRGMIMKRIFALMLALALTAVFFPNAPVAASSIGGTFGVGTWMESCQGMRFSIFDLDTAKTVSVVDMFSPRVEHYLSRYSSEEYIRNNKFLMFVGCKLDYLDQLNHVSGSKYSRLTNENFRLRLNDEGYSYSISFVSAPEMQKFLNPIVIVDSNNWVAPQYVKDLLIGSDAGLIDIGILHQLGFYAFSKPRGSTNAQYFLNNYVLVVEPVYFFPVYTVAGGTGDVPADTEMVFYGTPTELAIADTKLVDYLKSAGRKFGNITTHDYTGSIHQIMGRLTFFAGPAGVLTPQTKTFRLGSGETVTIEKSDDARQLYNKYALINRSDYTADIAMDIISGYGVDTLQMNEIKSLTLNINRSNTNFHSDTDVYLSFMLLNGSSEPMVRDADESYEFKLVLETLPDSEVQREDVVITSQGLPGMNETSQPSSTYIYKRYHLPDRAGKWRFKAKLYQNSGGTDVQIYYDTDNGFPIEGDDMAYGFEVNILRLNYITSADPTAYDLMPKGFVPPSVSEVENSLRRITHREWHYYRIVYREVDGEIKQEIRRVIESADAEITKSDGIHFYPNIPSRTDSSTGLKLCRSGYGIGIYLPLSGITGNYRDGFCSGLATYPESMFSEGCRIELENDVYQLEKNSNSMYFSNMLKSDYSRVHFTPIWYPDGEYPVVVQLFDNWTPSGELADFKVYTVVMRGTIYDDWYISRR